MAASAFVVELPRGVAANLKNGADVMVVWAEDAAQAKNICAAKFSGDGGASDVWSGATATAIVAPSDLTGWRFEIVVSHPTTLAVVADATYTGVASDTIDLVGAALETALKATASIANAAYTSGTNTLVIAAGGSDALGDHIVNVSVYPPAADVDTDEKVSISDYISSTTDQGLSSADLSCVFADVAVPLVYAYYRQVA